MAGVPNTSIGPGENVVRTDPDGPSNASDYIANGLLISDANGVPYQPGQVIPPGTVVRIYAGLGVNLPGMRSTAAGGLGDIPFGQQNRIDEAGIGLTNAQTAETLAGIPIAQGQLANQTALTNAQIQQMGAQVQQAERQHALDVARFGEEQARRLLDERLAAINVQFLGYDAGLRGAQFDLAQDQFNFTQRSDLARGKLDILGMLADRSGPQDWVKYANLLDGLSPPTPTASTTINPFSILDGLYEPSNVQRPQAPAPAFTPSQPTPYAPAAPANPGAMAPPAAAPNPLAQGSGVRPPGQQVTEQSGIGAGLVASASHPRAAQGTSQAAPAPQQPMGTLVQGSNTAPTPDEYVWIGGQRIRRPQGLAGGGMMDGRMAIVGDSRSGRPTGHEELVINLNPDPADQIAVIPLREPSLLDMAGEGVPRAASGGVYNFGDPNSITYNRYAPQDVGNLGFLQRNRQGGRGREFGGLGADLVGARSGGNREPWAINLQSFGNMAPTQQRMLQGYYEDDLGVSFEDVLAQARRAAPVGASLPVTRYTGR